MKELNRSHYVGSLSELGKYLPGIMSTDKSTSGSGELVSLAFLKLVFSKKATKLTKSSPSIWHYVVSVKPTVKISSIFVAFLENMNFTSAVKL